MCIYVRMYIHLQISIEGVKTTNKKSVIVKARIELCPLCVQSYVAHFLLFSFTFHIHGYEM